MRSTQLMELNLHVKLHTDLAAPVARDFAGKVCHNRSGDLSEPDSQAKTFHNKIREFLGRGRLYCKSIPESLTKLAKIQRKVGLNIRVFSVWAFCCHMWALQEQHSELHEKSKMI